MFSVLTPIDALTLLVGLSSKDSKGWSWEMARLNIAVAVIFSPVNSIVIILGLATIEGTVGWFDGGPKLTPPFSDWFHFEASQLAIVPKLAKLMIPFAPWAT